MPHIIISKSVLETAKKKLLHKSLHEEGATNGWTIQVLRIKVRQALEEEMDNKFDQLDTPDKMITFLLATGSVGNHSICDMLSIKISD